MVELSNGCICCTINEGLVDAVYRVLEREDRIDCMVKRVILDYHISLFPFPPSAPSAPSAVKNLT